MNNWRDAEPQSPYSQESRYSFQAQHRTSREESEDPDVPRQLANQPGTAHQEPTQIISPTFRQTDPDP